MFRRRFICVGGGVIFCAFFALCSTGYAQQQAGDVAAEQSLLLYDEEGGIIGLGPKGRITMEQGQLLALRRLRGEVLGSLIYDVNDRYFYEYRILVPDQSIYQIEINALNGELHRIEVEYLSPDAKLPMELLPEETVKELARNYVNEKTLGRRKPEIRKIDIAVRDRAPVYILEVKKSGQVYDVAIDAQDGSIVEFEKQ